MSSFAALLWATPLPLFYLSAACLLPTCATARHFFKKVSLPVAELARARHVAEKDALYHIYIVYRPVQDTGRSL